MMTVFKMNPEGKLKLRYEAEVVERRTQGVILHALWTLPARDLGYTVFEPGDNFTEFYYTDRWFDVLEVVSANGRRKGWYCDIAEPAVMQSNELKQVDLFLDVWVDARGEALILDEDEYEAANLSEAQRRGARQGLQELLRMLEAREEAFASLRQQDTC